MALSSDLMSQFAKATVGTEKQKTETNAYGTVVMVGNEVYVRLDGAGEDRLIPMETTAEVKDGERVTIRIKNHNATITGNVSSPAARIGSVEEINGKVAVAIEELEAQKAVIENLNATYATIEELNATKATIESLDAKFVKTEDLEAEYATIEKLESDYITAEVLNAQYAKVGDISAVNAAIYNLNSTYAEITRLNAEKIAANEAVIKNLDTDYANIDFANIGEAAIQKLFSDSGIIDNLIMQDGNVTGNLVGVTISGDLIEGNTIKADKLIVKGSDGLYYKLNVDGGVTTSEELTEEELQNGIHGSIIIAKSITADQIYVSDLVAFDATIGGFNITDNAIYSEVKSSVDNTTEGIYMDRDGQFAVGGTSHYLKYYKLDDGSRKLDISAKSIVLSASGTNVEDELDNMNTELTSDINHTNEQITGYDSRIEILENCIQALVVDENGQTWLVHDGSGWKFNLSPIQDRIDSISEGLNSLTNDVSDVSSSVDTLESAIKDINDLTEHVDIGPYTYIDDDGNTKTEPSISLYEDDSDFKHTITNTQALYMDGQNVSTRINNEGITTDNVTVSNEFRHDGWVWKTRSNGNYGLS